MFSKSLTGMDCIAAAMNLDAQKKVKLLAVMHNTGLPTGVGAISVLFNHYGRNDIPIGAYKGNFSANMPGKHLVDIGYRKDHKALFSVKGVKAGITFQMGVSCSSCTTAAFANSRVGVIVSFVLRALELKSGPNI